MALVFHNYKRRAMVSVVYTIGEFNVFIETAQQITDKMFCAHDDKGHVVHWSDVTDEWLCGNENGDIVFNSPSLPAALMAMYAATQIPSSKWTTMDY